MGTRLVNIGATLAFAMAAAACARKDFPIFKYEVDQPLQRFATCVYRDAQRRLDPAEAVEQTHLDEPQEIQITKHAAFGAIAWEVDATRAPNDGTLITMLYHPGLVGWDKEALASLNACTGGAPLKPAI